MIESAVKKVSPYDEEATINLMSRFAWKLTHTQEINTSDSHLETRNGDLYSVTEKQNYVKLTFERDTNMPNYKRIAELEKEYTSLTYSKPGLPIGKIVLAVFLCLTCWLAPIGIYQGYKIYKTVKANNAEWEEEFQEKAATIFAEVDSLTE